MPSLLHYLLDADIPGQSLAFPEEVHRNPAVTTWLRPPEKGLVEGAVSFWYNHRSLLTLNGAKQKLEAAQRVKELAWLEENFQDRPAVLKPGDFHHLLETLEREHIQNELIRSTMRVAEEMERSVDSLSILDQLKMRLRTIEQSRSRNVQSVALGEVLDECLEDYAARTTGAERFQGIPTGFQQYDTNSGGMFPGEELVIAGRHGVGKSMVLQALTHHAYNQGYNIMFVSQEMSVLQKSPYGITMGPLIMRFLAMDAEVPFHALRTGTLDEAEEKRVRACCAEMKKKENQFFFIPPGQASTVEDIDNELTLLRRNQQVDLLCVDYIQITHSSNGTSHRGKVEEVGAVVSELREIAIRHHLPVLTASQLNRDSVHAVDGKVGTEALSWSDEIGAVADVCWRLYQTKEDTETDLLTVDVLKARNSAMFQFKVRIDKTKMVLRDLLDFSQMGTKKKGKT